MTDQPPIVSLIRFLAFVMILVAVLLLVYGMFFETKPVVEKKCYNAFSKLSEPCGDAGSIASNLTVDLPNLSTIVNSSLVNTSLAMLKTFKQELNVAVEKNTRNEWITFKPNITRCLHGVWINGSCVRSLGGDELRNYTTWLKNQTDYNASNGLTPNKTYYLYYKFNCTTPPEDYVWDGFTCVVNSSHNLSCGMVKSWVGCSVV